MVVIRGQVELLLSKIEVGVEVEVEVEVRGTSVAFKNSDPGLAIISEMGHNKLRSKSTHLPNRKSYDRPLRC